MRKKKTTRRRPGRKPKKSTADAVADMAASGLVEDEIAQRLGVHKNTLRARHIDSIKAGKAAAAATEAEVAALTLEEYWVLHAMENMFGTEWDDLAGFLWRDANDKDASNIEQAFDNWKAAGGKYNCIGKSSRFDEEKAARYARIVQNYRDTTQKVET